MAVEMTLSLLLGTVFLISAVPKFRHPKGFILTVLEYRIVAPAVGRLYARLLPSTELFVALLFLAGIAVQLAAIVTSFLLLSFMVAISVNLARGRKLDCGCVGAGGRRRIGPGLLVQDAGLLAASIGLCARNDQLTGPASWSVLRLAVPPLGRGPEALIVCASVAASVPVGLTILHHVRKSRAQVNCSLPGRGHAVRGGNL